MSFQSGIRFLDAKNQLKGIGITINRKASTGEFRVNFVNGTEATAYYTNDLQDAIDTGIAMASHRRNPTYKKYSGREGSAEFRHMTLEEGKMLTYGDPIWALARDGSAVRVRLNGKVRRWKRDPDRIEVPYKYGMYEYGTFYSRDFGPNGMVLVPV